MVSDYFSACPAKIKSAGKACDDLPHRCGIDQLFTGATRGNHIAVSAPGVDILVPAPEATYQMTTGISVATAHVSGTSRCCWSAIRDSRRPTSAAS